MIKKVYFIFTLFFALSLNIKAQNQESLTDLMKSFMLDTTESMRLQANYKFIRVLKTTLDEENSFQKYSFDSLKAVSILYPTNKEFRLFSWRVRLEDGSTRHFGCIQLAKPNTPLIPLLDNTGYISFPEDTVLPSKGWYGAIYYDMLEIAKKKATYYVLVGMNGTEPFIGRKVIDVLEIKDGKAFFGKDIFHRKDVATKSRIILEYSRLANVNLTINKEKTIIQFDNLTPTDPKFEGQTYNYVPDGSVNAYKLVRNKWKYLDNYKRKPVK